MQLRSCIIFDKSHNISGHMTEQILVRSQ